MTKQSRRRRHLSVGTRELVAAAVFALVLPRLVAAVDRRALWAARVGW